MKRKIKLVGKAIWLEFAELAMTLLILAVFCAGIFAVFCVAAQLLAWVGGMMSENTRMAVLRILVVAFGVLVIGMMVFEAVTAIQCRYQRLAAAEEADARAERHGGIFGEMYKEYGAVENTLNNVAVEGDFVGGNKNV